MADHTTIDHRPEQSSRQYLKKIYDSRINIGYCPLNFVMYIYECVDYLMLRYCDKNVADWVDMNKINFLIPVKFQK